MATAHPAARNLCVAATCTTAIRHRGGKVWVGAWVAVRPALGMGRPAKAPGQNVWETSQVGVECLYSTLNAPLVRSVCGGVC